jgi:hypothetical protein
VPVVNCYACRNYFDGCGKTHPKNELIWAKHRDGKFWWGKAAAKTPGLWVRICVWCMEALAAGD